MQPRFFSVFEPIVLGAENLQIREFVLSPGPNRLPVINLQKTAASAGFSRCRVLVKAARRRDKNCFAKTRSQALALRRVHHACFFRRFFLRNHGFRQLRPWGSLRASIRFIVFRSHASSLGFGAAIDFLLCEVRQGFGPLFLRNCMCDQVLGLFKHGDLLF